MMSKAKEGMIKILGPLPVVAVLFAKDIHNAWLPQVTAERSKKQEFTYTFTIEDYTLTHTGSFSALPKDMVLGNVKSLCGLSIAYT